VSLGPGSLKCVVASRDREAIERTLRSRVGSDNLVHLHDATFIVYTDAEPATIRDWLLPHARPDATLLVVEFERWSGSGAIDRDWLTRRGH
jgi:hypothetical protein